ncbi:helix-turn-helix domain-containing protein [Sandaracinobacteroides saxicola]|uniref:Helix-turn-helix transcriptional regulator n=1 Tax=Sandaracinobacteroides saxicola TaxID=2759707 RepID=A0A7G5IIX4_9SPHN|nr:helix-turn-helix transcriptional regulator [Sandaracinobacteroides saxicola]QMW23316.1 helix-turn-helix transcriptional regulator [Sandaracinobacteroides saxicola]
MQDPQFITAPDGSRLVVLSEVLWNRLSRVVEENADLEAARAGLESIESDGGIPGEVVHATIRGAHPLVAWRQYRGMSQADLAHLAGTSQAAIARLEKVEPGAGRPATRRKLAKALAAPDWALDG